MAILIINLSPARHLDDFILNKHLIYASPRLEDNIELSEVNCSSSPDCNELINKVKILFHVSIELVITYVDVFGFYSFLPIFKNCNLPKLAILGDTHHGRCSLSKVHKYLVKSRIQHVALKQTKGQITIFQSMGYNVFCFGSYIVNPTFLSPNKNPGNFIAAFGSNSPYHFRRQLIIQKLKDLGLPILTSNVPRNQMFQAFNTAAAVLNVPLNSDVNYRFHEVAAAGGLLLTETLSQASRSYEYQDASTCFVEYKSINDLHDLCRFALQNSKSYQEKKESAFDSLKVNRTKTAIEFSQYLENVICEKYFNHIQHSSKTSQYDALCAFEIYQEQNRLKLVSPVFKSDHIKFPSDWLTSFNAYDYSSK